MDQREGRGWGKGMEEMMHHRSKGCVNELS